MNCEIMNFAAGAEKSVIFARYYSSLVAGDNNSRSVFFVNSY